MQVTTKLMFAFFFVTIITVTTGFSGARKDPGPETPAATSPKSGEKWHGGKPHAAVEVDAGSPKLGAPGTDIPVTFTVTPSEDCKSLRIRLRGLDGVSVADESEHLQAECVAGKPVQVTAMARVPSKVRGSVVADVSVVTESEGGDVERSMTRSVPVAASDAVTLKSKSLPTNMKVESSDDGEKLIVSPADKR